MKFCLVAWSFNFFSNILIYYYLIISSDANSRFNVSFFWGRDYYRPCPGHTAPPGGGGVEFEWWDKRGSPITRAATPRRNRSRGAARASSSGVGVSAVCNLRRSECTQNRTNVHAADGCTGLHSAAAGRARRGDGKNATAARTQRVPPTTRRTMHSAERASGRGPARGRTLSAYA